MFAPIDKFVQIIYMELERPTDLFVGHVPLEVPVTPRNRHPEIFSRFLNGEQRGADLLTVSHALYSTTSLIFFEYPL